MTIERQSDEKNSTERLMQGLKRYPVLEREEEMRLALQYQRTRDPGIARRLVEGHLRLVIKIAHECCFQQTMLPDLIQEGCLGLMRAVAKYDPARGVRLSSYASWWIRANIFHYIMTNARIVRVATTFAQRKLFFSLRRETQKLRAEGELPDTVALARRLRVPEGDVLEMSARLAARDVHFGSGSDAKGAASEADLAHPEAPPDEVLATHEVRAVVRRHMQELDGDLEGRERVIFDERLCAEEPLTLQEVGKRFGLSRERARQIESRLKRRLRADLEILLGEAACG